MHALQGCSRKIRALLILHWSSAELWRMQESVWIQEASLSHEIRHLGWGIQNSIRSEKSSESKNLRKK